jgi:hypothetical protein
VTVAPAGDRGPGPDIDPALAARLDAARPGDTVEALVLVRGEARARLATGPAGAAASLPEVVRRALGPTPPEAVRARVLPRLGALAVAGPAEFLRRLLADPDVVSATLPEA